MKILKAAIILGGLMYDTPLVQCSPVSFDAIGPHKNSKPSTSIDSVIFAPVARGPSDSATDPSDDLSREQSDKSSIALSTRQFRRPSPLTFFSIVTATRLLYARIRTHLWSLKIYQIFAERALTAALHDAVNRVAHGEQMDLGRTYTLFYADGFSLTLHPSAAYRSVDELFVTWEDVRATLQFLLDLVVAHQFNLGCFSASVYAHRDTQPLAEITYAGPMVSDAAYYYAHAHAHPHPHAGLDGGSGVANGDP
ncbi:MAG: hypothetical protein M1838_003780 [Thelocarpon superellum]|nr:MAG: hypothetical protein M1838_003780 [Thelocarpon superellum]